MVTPPVGIEYDNTIEASSLSTDQVAELTLSNNQYSKIELKAKLAEQSTQAGVQSQQTEIYKSDEVGDKAFNDDL